MLHDVDRLKAALAPLVGLPLWASHRAADMQSFQLGDKQLRTTEVGPRRGETHEVGTYALHVQCAWRVRGPSGIVVASKDRGYKSARGEVRCDVRIRDWLAPGPHVVERVDADASGGIAIAFAGGFALDVFPDSSLDGEYSEHWRVFRPGDTSASSHVVVTGRGVED